MRSIAHFSSRIYHCAFFILRCAVSNAQCEMRNAKCQIRNPQWSVLPLIFLAITAASCSPNMSEQPKYKSLAQSRFFSDGRSARAPLSGTVAQGNLRADESLYRGRVKGELIGRIPVPVTRQLLERGRDRFDIFCSPCHGRLGDGEGMVTRRGLRQPPSYHIDRLREAPDGHFFDVITNGFGAMPSYASRIPVHDRWAITAYVRVLQLSQNARFEEVPSVEQKSLGENTK